MVRRLRLSLGGLGLLLAAFAWASPAAAQGKPRAKPAKVTKAAPAKPKKAPKPKPEVEPTEKEDAAAEPASKAPPEGDSKPRGSQATDPPANKATVKEKEGPEGVKTYQFGAIEVEGRQKSPQLIYFLRRVRAEFDAGTLGHRSFLGELKDTRNDTAFR